MNQSTYVPHIEALCAELESGRRLSSKVLPDVESSVAYDTIRLACTQPNHPIRAALVAGGDLVTEVANIRPGETLAGQLDGAALIAVVVAMLVLEYDKEARAARELGRVAPADELEVVMQNTDTNPLGADPDPVQLALAAYLRGDDDVTVQLATAVYGRAASYGTKAELARTCACFLSECGTLLTVNPALVEAVVASPPTKPPMVDASTSPRTRFFYDAAVHPFSASFDDAGVVSPIASPAVSSVGAEDVSEKNRFLEPTENAGVGGSLDEMIMRALDLSL